MKEKNKILFLTPFFGNSGSEIALHNILQHWPSLQKETLAVSSVEHGTLAAQLNAGVDFYCFNDFRNNRSRWWKRLLRMPFSLLKKNNEKDSYITFLFSAAQPDLVVLNTLIMTEYLPLIKKMNVPVVLYVHEMDWTFSHFSKKQLIEMTTLPDLVICCSNASATGFQQLGRVEKLNVLYPGVAFDKIRITKTRNEMKELLAIPLDHYVIGMSGSLDRNKDPKIFINVAKELLKIDNRYHFVWIGGKNDTGDGYYAERLAHANKISERVHFLGQQTADYFNYLNGLDCFFLTSVFDSFPLVMIEAGYLQKPIIGFNSGGISEFVTSETGLLLESRDAEKSAIEIHNYLQMLHSVFDADKAKKNAESYSAQNSAVNFQRTVTNLL